MPETRSRQLRTIILQDDLKPSMADIDLTKKTQTACKFMDINLVDPIIVSPSEGTCYSFADEGII